MFRCFIAVIVSIAITTACRADAILLPNGRSLERIDFDRHVHALLDRQGCNAGACHGNRDGKGGFSLSLFAGSPQRDYDQIAQKFQGRYVNVGDPERSLLLLKATAQVKHDGGRRLVPGSWEYQVLRQWIADGARRQHGQRDVQDLRLVVSERLMEVTEKWQLKVVARYAEGAEEDVTCFCDYRIPEPMFPLPGGEKVAVRVNKTGEVHAVRPGDAAVLVFYRGKVRTLRVQVAQPVAKGFVFPRVQEVNFIDREVFRSLRRASIVPADVCGDEQFLRRLSIDVLGTIPTPDEVRAFLADKRPDKRIRKIDQFLAHPRHAALLAMQVCEMTDLIGGFSDSARTPRVKMAQMAHEWFRKRLQANVPYDRIVTDVLTATSKEGRTDDDWLKEKEAMAAAATGFGTSYAQRATLDHFWRAEHTPRPTSDLFARNNTHPRKDPAPYEVLAERVATAFMGVQLDCARCHVHPLDAWTPADYQAFTGVFSQVRLEPISVDRKLPAKKQQVQRGRGAVSREVYLAEPTGPSVDPETGGALKPRLLGGPEIELKGDARAALARWLTHADNPYFARHFVNTLWQHYFGVSLVQTTDSYTSALSPTNTTLLDLLAQDFIANKFDIRRLERTILLSRVYQLAPTLNDSNKNDRTCFSRAVPHRMNARIAAELIHAVLETTENFGTGVHAALTPIEVMHLGDVGRAFTTSEPYKTRVDQIVAGFARTELMSRCDSEPGIASYLHAYGSSEITSLFARSKRIQRLAKSKLSIDEMLDECFLAALSHPPSPEHRKIAGDYMRRDPSKLAVNLENIFWALINTKEFSMRH